MDKRLSDDKLSPAVPLYECNSFLIPLSPFPPFAINSLSETLYASNSIQDVNSYDVLEHACNLVVKGTLS